MTGMIGHGYRVLEYWQARAAGSLPADAIRQLADRVKVDTYAWLEVSAKEYSQSAPINFGAERIEQISEAAGIDTQARANVIDATRRQRHALIPLDPSNWRRLFVHNGRVLSALPELDEEHPLQRPERAASLLAVMKSLPVPAAQENARPDQALAEGEQTIIKPKLNIGSVEPEQAKAYAFLDIQQNGQTVQRIAIKESTVVIGRADPKRQIASDIDLTPFDPQSTVSRQHARLHLDEPPFMLEDLKSRNKTRLGELILVPYQSEPLQNGDTISFGSVKAIFRLLGTSTLPEPWSPS